MSWLNDSDNEEKEPEYGREGITFLVDCRRSMFIKDLLQPIYDDFQEGNKQNAEFYSAFVFALQCCKEFMMHKVQCVGKTVTSLLFFGIENDDFTRKYNVEFQPLCDSSAEKIKCLDIIITSKTHNDFETKYGHSVDAHLADALSACIASFNQCPLKLSSKKILLFTKDDNPDGSFPDRQLQIRKRAGDLREANIDIELIPFGCNFDTEKFYREIIQIAKKDNFVIIKPIINADIDEVLDVINKENYRKRTLANLKFTISNQVVISVGLLRFTSKKRYLKKEYLSRESSEQVQQVRQTVHSETGATVRPYDVVKTTVIGSKEIIFSSDELHRLKKVFEPGITLLGFKPKDSWKAEFQCNAPFFLFPDESVIKGSLQFFQALLCRCISLEKIAVCILVTRFNSRPRYALLVPQEEVIDMKTTQLILPAGFLVYYLPFAGMLGDLPVGDINQDINEEIDSDKMLLVSQIIRKMRNKNYVPECFENPSLTKQWNNIEALALEMSNPKPFIDTTIAPLSDLKKIIGNLSVAFNDAFTLSHGTKRESGTSLEGSSASKRRKFMELLDNRMVNKMTVAELNDLLKCVPNLNTRNLKKADLVNLVYSNAERIRKF